MKKIIITIFLILNITSIKADFVLTVQNECTDCQFVLEPVVENNSTLLYEELTEQDVLDLQAALRPYELDSNNDEYCNWNDEESDCYDDFDWVKQSYESTKKITIDSESDLVPALRKLQLIDSIRFKANISVPEYFKNWNIKTLSFENVTGQVSNLNGQYLENIWFKNSTPIFDNDFDYSNTRLVYVSNSSNSTFPDISKFVNIEELDISNNTITELPIYLASFTRLKLLDISNNHIVTVPIILEVLDSVRDLNVSDNEISNFDLDLREMNSLVNIYLSSPSIESMSLGFCDSWNTGNYRTNDRGGESYINSFCI